MHQMLYVACATSFYPSLNLNSSRLLLFRQDILKSWRNQQGRMERLNYCIRSYRSSTTFLIRFPSPDDRPRFDKLLFFPRGIEKHRLDCRADFATGCDCKPKLRICVNYERWHSERAAWYVQCIVPDPGSKQYCSMLWQCSQHLTAQHRPIFVRVPSIF